MIRCRTCNYIKGNTTALGGCYCDESLAIRSEMKKIFRVGFGFDPDRLTTGSRWESFQQNTWIWLPEREWASKANSSRPDCVVVIEFFDSTIAHYLYEEFDYGDRGKPLSTSREYFEELSNEEFKRKYLNE